VRAFADGLTTDSTTDFITPKKLGQADSRIGTDLETDFEIIVVTGAEREKVEGLVAGLAEKYPVRCIFNEGYEAGEMLSSIQRGLARIGPEVGAALIGLGDQPRVESRTARSIVEAFESSQARIVVPSYKMRRGHPWLVEKGLWGEILAIRAPQTLRDFLNAHADEIEYVIVDTSSVIEDLDTPEDYQRFCDKLRPGETRA